MKRRAFKPSSSARKPHGGREGPVDAPLPRKTLADVPHTVPELPAAYLARNEDLAQLKTALLDKGGSSSTALTSKKRQNKVGAHGMVSEGFAEHCRLFCMYLLIGLFIGIYCGINNIIL